MIINIDLFQLFEVSSIILKSSIRDVGVRSKARDEPWRKYLEREGAIISYSFFVEVLASVVGTENCNNE